MEKSFITGKGAVIQIGVKLGEGGEGSVFQVPTKPSQVAKLYHHHKVPDARKQRKLTFMAATADAELLKYAAWPQETLHATYGGPVVGFLMARVTAPAPIHLLYSPAHRRQDYPKAAWDFLVCTARNTAAAFETLHSHGHVLGDVNQRNFLVGNDSTVVLIDCDSFQINAKGEIHRCEVGVSHFTPPELQCLKSYGRIERTCNHDNFGLALLIFHILFGGRHPYSGVPLNKSVGQALETDIKAFRYAYARDARLRGIAPPPKSIPLALVSDGVRGMFETAFTELGASSGRPNARQWKAALDSMRQRLKKCETSSMHFYPDHLSCCPWCELESQGVIYFIDLGLGFTTTASGFDVRKAWAVIEAVPAPVRVIIPNMANITVMPVPLPPDVSDTGPVALIRILIVLGALGLTVAAPGAWFLIVIGAVVAYIKSGSAGKAKRDEERTKRRAALDQALMDYEALENHVRKEKGPDGFVAKKQELARLRDEYQSLPTIEKKELERLHATAEERQKQQFLDRCFIDSANISGIGPAKKAALRSFGIETARDVDWQKVQSVRGFGEVLTRAVVDWKKSCERRFAFNASSAVSEADKNAVRAKIAMRKRAIEVVLSSGAADLQRFQREAAKNASTLTTRLNSAAKKLVQAKANLAMV